MILSLTISAFVIGSVYGLIALGYSLIYSASGLMTFCQGEILMFGAFVGLSFFRYLNWPFGLALLATLVVMFIIGMLIERLLIRPILSKQAQGIYVVLATIALGIVLTNSAQQIWGTTSPIAGLEQGFWLNEMLHGLEHSQVVDGGGITLIGKC